MNLPKSILYVIVGIIVLVVGAFVFIGKNASNKTQVAQPENTQAVVSPTPSKYADWTYFRNGYGIKIPSDWKNTSDTGGTAVLEPGSKVGSITKISITVLSDAKATGQRFTTQTEFDQWSAVDGEVQGKIQKLDNVLVDGSKAVMLLDTSGGENEWTVIVWTRKDNINLYITVNGNEKYSEEDAAAIDYLVSSFRFQAPTSAPGEGKK